MAESLRKRVPADHGVREQVVPNFEPDRVERVARSILDVVPPILVFVISCFGLNYFDAYRVAHFDPRVNRTYLGLGILLSSMVIMVKIYMEAYRGSMLKEEVTYDTNPRATHAAMALIFGSGVTLTLAVWPVWGSQTLVVMGLFGIGILFPLAVVIPNYAHNMIYLAFWSWEALLFAGYLDGER